MAAGALRFYHSNNIDVPNDVSVASYDRIVNDDLLYVHPSYVMMDPALIGRTLSEFIVERIQHKSDHNIIANRTVRFPAKLVPGNGTKMI